MKDSTKKSLGKASTALNYLSDVAKGVATANAGYQDTPSAKGGSSVEEEKRKRTVDISPFDEDDTETAAGRL